MLNTRFEKPIKLQRERERKKEREFVENGGAVAVARANLQEI